MTDLEPAGGTTNPTDRRRGMWYGVAAYLVWGLSPLFWNLTDDGDAVDFLLHRALWALPILAIALSLRHKWPEVREAYRSGRSRIITVIAAGLLAINWGVFLWAVTNEQVVEASLGYFINPLVSVALGVVVLREHLRRLQWVAVGIAAAGVIAMTIRVGNLPWVAIALALSFGTYGLLKKNPATPGPLVSLFGEVTVMALPALVVLTLFRDSQTGGFGSSVGMSVFLVGTGLITVIPLLLFGAAAKRIKLSTIGLLQYIAPTMQFLLGVTVFDEHLSTDALIGFVCVWVALALYTWDNVRATTRSGSLVA